MDLKEYTEKRHFEKTPEPPAEREEGELIFVIHKHAAGTSTTTSGWRWRGC